MDETKGSGCLGHSNWFICSLLSHFCSRNFPTFALSYWGGQFLLPQLFLWYFVIHCALISTISWLKLFPTEDMKQIPTTEWMEHAVFSLSPTSVTIYKDVLKRCNRTIENLVLIERRLSRASSTGICAKKWNQQRCLHFFQPHFRLYYFRFLND